MTEANTLVQVESGRARRRCLMCTEIWATNHWRKQRKYPYRGPDMCRKGLHLLTPDNTMDRDDLGLVCRECNRAWFRLVKVEGRYRRVRCATPYCRRVSNRSVDRTDLFYCREHRP